jgi:enoyl-CoA hydratase
MNDILYETRDGVAIVTINRPTKRNALNLAACASLLECWKRAEDDPHVFVVIVTATGDKAFCAGFDITEKRVDGRPTIEDFSPRLGTTCRMTKPIIAAVKGPAIAAGMYLVEACDLCVAAESAWFALSEVKLGIGLHPFVQSLWTLPQRVLLELMITGDPLPARRAYDLGFVNRVVPPGELMTAALDLAQVIVRNAPLVVQASKDMIYRGQAAMGMEDALAESSLAFDRVNHSLDAEEGFRAWTERRPPVWKGH